MPYLKNDLIKNAEKLYSPNLIMLQFDELESENSNFFFFFQMNQKSLIQKRNLLKARTKTTFWYQTWQIC